MKVILKDADGDAVADTVVPEYVVHGGKLYLQFAAQSGPDVTYREVSRYWFNPAGADNEPDVFVQPVADADPRV